jgi:transglutaminase-like putative cysteine protease
MRLEILHTTVYRYSESKTFGPHRLMMRPREGHHLTIEASRLEIFPVHTLRWVQDVYDNSIAMVSFSRPADELRIISEVTVKHFDSNPFNFLLAPHAVKYPFLPDPSEQADIAPFLELIYPQDREAIQAWLAPYWKPGQVVDTLELLMSLNTAIRRDFLYLRREETGVQSPAETLKKMSGSCRDYATLLMEAVRVLGFPSRFISGYIHQPDANGQDHGATHAWTDIYLPGAGWKAFDPTGGILACDIHVPIAVARHPGGAAPVSGSFSGSSDTCVSMMVTVQVRSVE